MVIAKKKVSKEAFIALIKEEWQDLPLEVITNNILSTPTYQKYW